MDHDLPVTRWREDYDILMPAHPNKDEKSRLTFYIDWLAEKGLAWHSPDLAGYRDYLLNERTAIDQRTGEETPATLAPRTVSAHLSTIRGRYNAILRDNKVRKKLYALTPDDASASDKKAFVDEVLVRIQNAVHPTTAPLPEHTVQDYSDSEFLRLTPDQVKKLLRQPGLKSPVGQRDTALIALMICTGVREAELVAIDVDDLRQSLDGEIALRVREGKGNKQRLVPYGELIWCLKYVERWLEVAEIESGAVFRGFYRGYTKVRKTRLTTRAVNLIMNQYVIDINGEDRTVNPHDLRRSYARNAYDNGMDMERIRQNLGHVSIHTTQTYIGSLTGKQRRPPKLFSPPHRL